jgi:3-hydroxybutyryl-CoA dehydratase
LIEKLEDKKMLRLATKCFNQNGEVVLDGEALHYIQR